MISHRTSFKNIGQYLIGLTGNICSGKSKATEYFKDMGASVIDLDEVTHDIYKKNIPLKYKLYKEFGCIFNKKLEVDREKLGKIVFSNKSKMKKLEIIAWPYVEKEREKRVKNKEGIIIVEAALLYESRLDKKFDRNILITVNEELQVKRLMKKKNISKEEALKRISLQTPQLEKIEKSDYIISNNGSLELLKRNVEDAWELLNKEFLSKKHLSTSG